LHYHLFIMNDTPQRRTLTLEPGDAHLLARILKVRVWAMSHRQAEFARKDQVDANVWLSVTNELEASRRLLAQLGP
jgi:hypothetical protein